MLGIEILLSICRTRRYAMKRAVGTVQFYTYNIIDI